MQEYNIVLSIAGSDSSGGAGIQADIKTITRLGCYAATVVTALTAQNTQGVSSIFSVPINLVRQQLDVICTDFMPHAVKIGMLHRVEVIQWLKTALPVFQKRAIPVVLDPVMVAQGGHLLITQNAVHALHGLFPLVSMITPNLPEAECLITKAITSVADMKLAAIQLGQKYRCHVLLKGGHLNHEMAIDVLYLYDEDECVLYNMPFIQTKNRHGTGCTLSSAIACGLAQKKSLLDAMLTAKRYVYEAIKSGSQYQIGKGSGPVNHLF